MKTKFANDLIRYLETTAGPSYDKLAEQFFYGEMYLDELEDDTPEGWDNMNVSFDLMDSYGGEDMGSESWSVYKFTDKATGEEVYIKFDGWYQSYHGAEYENCFVVQPKEKKVTVYE